MSGGSLAVTNGDELVKEVCRRAELLHLEYHEQVLVARRIWGAKRKIDVIIRDQDARKTLGIECKYQAAPGSAEEKIPATIQDMTAWPIPGLLVFAGDGFSQNMTSFLISTGKAVELHDLDNYLRLFFGLPLQ